MKFTLLYPYSTFLQYPETYRSFRNDNENSFTFRKQSLYQRDLTWNLAPVQTARNSSSPLLKTHIVRYPARARQNEGLDEKDSNEICLVCLFQWGLLLKFLGTSQRVMGLLVTLPGF